MRESRRSPLDVAESRSVIKQPYEVLHEADYGRSRLYLLRTPHEYITLWCNRYRYRWAGFEVQSVSRTNAEPVLTVANGCRTLDDDPSVTLFGVEVSDRSVRYIEAGAGEDRVRRDVPDTGLVLFIWPDRRFELEDLNPVALSSDGQVLYRYEVRHQDGVVRLPDDLRWYKERAPETSLSTISYLDPEVQLRTVETGGYFYTEPSCSVSPDGEYLGGILGYTAVKAFLVEADGSATTVYRMKLLPGETPSLIFAGWRSETECLFIISGVQPDGDHKGERGVSIRVGNVVTALSREAAFVPATRWRMSWMTADRKSLYVHVSQYLVGLNLETWQHRTVAELPGYDGLFTVLPSPSGEQVLHQLYEPDRDGVVVLDLSTGTERMLVSKGDTYSFGPMWSPDGSMIAVYTAPKLPAVPGEPVTYDLFTGDDAPLPVSRRITILDPSGETVLTIDAEESYCYDFRWAQDSSVVSYAEGIVPESRTAGGPSFLAESLTLQMIPGRGSTPLIA